MDVIRLGASIAALPLIPFLFRHHFLVLVLLRPSQGILLGGGYLARTDRVSLLAVIAAAVPLQIVAVWLSDAGRDYEPTEVVLFTQATQTGCGVGQSSTGPFYCPRDHLVYIDLTFFGELRTRFGAAGDFAQAYVIAHEVGHHVQTVLGISDQVQSREDGIKLELQADCFAGVWGHAAHAAGLLERGDLEEGLTAAAAIGDDRIQERTQGRVDPETWTHGSSDQRVESFRRGFDTGDPDRCDTSSKSN